MKVRELRELLSAYDQDAEVRAVSSFDVPTNELWEITDIDINDEDDVVLELG